MALYKDGNPVSGINSIPRLTLAQYNALNVKPEFWVRTDAPESYKKLSADQVSYDSNNTVKDKIDSDNTKTNVAVTSLVSGVTVDINKSCKIGNTLYLIVKGHYTGTLSNITCLGVDISSLSVANYTFPIGLGQEWNINGIGYGYIDSNKRITITASVTSGYFHICQALPLA